MRITLDQVSLSYQPGTHLESPALKGISVSVEPGERLGIAGPTGSGKSTLLAVMAGLMEVSGGSVEHEGVPISAKHPPTAGRIGLGLQSPENCLFGKTVYEDVSFGPQRLGLADGQGGGSMGELVSRSLESVGLDAARFSQRNPFSLSAGEQRRVALAGLIAMDPEVLLLDEPTAYLDPATRRDLIQRLVAMNRDRGTAIVIVGHDMDEMAAFADRLVIMDDGRVAVTDTATELLGDAEILQRYRLQAPAAVRLSDELARCSGQQVGTALSEQDAVGLLQRLLGGRDGGRQ